jgi:hypothetical protein
MPKRQLADRIFDEILSFRRPRPLVEELDESLTEQPRNAQTAQERVLEESIPVGGRRRELIVE